MVTAIVGVVCFIAGGLAGAMVMALCQAAKGVDDLRYCDNCLYGRQMRHDKGNGRCTSTSRQDDWQCYAHDGWKCPTYYPEPELFPVDDFKGCDADD